MEDILTFRKMITPSIIHIIFWVLVLFSVLGALGTMFAGQFILGLVSLIVGPIMIRVSCEGVILLFSIHDRLTEIRDELKK